MPAYSLEQVQQPQVVCHQALICSGLSIDQTPPAVSKIHPLHGGYGLVGVPF